MLLFYQLYLNPMPSVNNLPSYTDNKFPVEEVFFTYYYNRANPNNMPRLSHKRGFV